MRQILPSRSLSLHLKQKSEAMSASVEARPHVEDWDEVVRADCAAEDLTGIRRLRIREWEYISDGGPAIGGWDLGPTSPELLCGVVSTCLTHTYLCLAASQQVSLDHVRVTVTAKNNDGRFFGLSSDRPIAPYDIAAEVDIASSTLDPTALAEFIDQGQATCPILHLLRTPNRVVVTQAGGRSR